MPKKKTKTTITNEKSEQRAQEAVSLSSEAVEKIRIAIDNAVKIARKVDIHEPSSSKGTTMWLKVVGGFRSGLSELGWTTVDTNKQQSLSVSPDGKIAIMASSGCPRTGTDKAPSFKNIKGTVMEYEAQSNQLSLPFDYGPDDQLPRPSPPPRITGGHEELWIILHHWVEESDEYEGESIVRLEISKPLAVNGTSCIWDERIIFDPIIVGSDLELETDDEDNTDNLVVPLSRK